MWLFDPKWIVFITVKYERGEKNARNISAKPILREGDSLAAMVSEQEEPIKSIVWAVLNEFTTEMLSLSRVSY